MSNIYSLLQSLLPTGPIQMLGLFVVLFPISWGIMLGIGTFKPKIISSRVARIRYVLLVNFILSILSLQAIHAYYNKELISKNHDLETKRDKSNQNVQESTSTLTEVIKLKDEVVNKSNSNKAVEKSFDEMRRENASMNKVLLAELDEIEDSYVKQKNKMIDVYWNLINEATRKSFSKHHASKMSKEVNKIEKYDMAGCVADTKLVVKVEKDYKDRIAFHYKGDGYLPTKCKNYSLYSNLIMAIDYNKANDNTNAKLHLTKSLEYMKSNSNYPKDGLFLIYSEFIKISLRAYDLKKAKEFINSTLRIYPSHSEAKFFKKNLMKFKLMANNIRTYRVKINKFKKQRVAILAKIKILQKDFDKP